MRGTEYDYGGIILLPAKSKLTYFLLSTIVEHLRTTALALARAWHISGTNLHITLINDP